MDKSDCPPLRCGFIHIASKGTPSANELTVMSDIVRRIMSPQKSHGTGSQPRIIINFADNNSSKPLIAVIDDYKPLLLPASEGNEFVQALADHKLTTLLAIIDTDGRTKSQIRDLYAEIHKFGERKIGAVTHCISQQTLQSQFDDHTRLKNYFPLGTLWKISAMHGGQNFKSPTSGERSSDRLMVVGAHVSRPGPDAARYCPSIASVVTSNGDGFLQFSGSVRLQPTCSPIVPNSNRTKYHVDHTIKELEDMMSGQIQAWKAFNPDLAPEIVFFRDGLDIVKNGDVDTVVQGIVESETKMILNAFTSKWGHEALSLTYVLVNKRRKSMVTYGRSDLAKHLGKQNIESYSVVPQGTHTSKHKYYSMPNDLDGSRQGRDLLVNLVCYKPRGSRLR
jgi:hypothetical protein